VAPFARSFIPLVVGQADRLLENWPAIALIAAFCVVVGGLFKKKFLRFGWEVDALLAEKAVRLADRDAQVVELKAELANLKRSFGDVQAVLSRSNATNAKATKTLESVSAILAARAAKPAPPARGQGGREEGGTGRENEGGA
jgi:hypothetical protein